MSPLLIKISKDFATLFTTINPIATLALFAELTASLSQPSQPLRRSRQLRRDEPGVTCLRSTTAWQAGG
jgi:small neutral amino acid transporter SnatA (MarC family)